MLAPPLPNAPMVLAAPVAELIRCRFAEPEATP
jgi:hypothetical protein